MTHSIRSTHTAHSREHDSSHGGPEDFHALWDFFFFFISIVIHALMLAPFVLLLCLALSLAIAALDATTARNTANRYRIP